jgi:hypothetical protein
MVDMRYVVSILLFSTTVMSQEWNPSMLNEEFYSASEKQIIKKAFQQDYTINKRKQRVQHAGNHAMETIIRLEAREVKKWLQKHGGKQLIMWPEDSWMINKYLDQILKEERI